MYSAEVLPIQVVFAKHISTVWRHLPLILFVTAIALAIFAYGGLVGKYRIFPYSVIDAGVKTGRIMLNANDRGQFLQFSHVSIEDAPGKRIHFVHGSMLSDPVLWYGARFQFMDHCPENGCLAVQFSEIGEVAHAWPYRPKELEQLADSSQRDDFPYELSPIFSFTRDVRPIGILKYPNDDLLVTFQLRNAFPFGGGVARVDRDGHPVWFRSDYSHHWPHMRDDDVALIPSLRIVTSPILLENPSDDTSFELDCRRGKAYRDTVNVVDESGDLVRTIDVLGIFLDSPHSLLLLSSTNHCDPVHLNFIYEIRESVRGDPGISPGDLVLSMRNISAFAILDGETEKINRLVRGTFSQQHSVEHLDGSKFLMFDNHGGDESGGPSRLLEIDLSDGTERTVFPNFDTPDHLRKLFSKTAGKIDISPDGQRVMIAFSDEGVAVEVRLLDGEVLNVFTSLHDVSNVEQFNEERKTNAALFRIFGLDYLRRQ